MQRQIAAASFIACHVSAPSDVPPDAIIFSAGTLGCELGEKLDYLGFLNHKILGKRADL